MGVVPEKGKGIVYLWAEQTQVSGDVIFKRIDHRRISFDQFLAYVREKIGIEMSKKWNVRITDTGNGFYLILGDGWVAGDTIGVFVPSGSLDNLKTIERLLGETGKFGTKPQLSSELVSEHYIKLYLN